MLLNSPYENEPGCLSILNENLNSSKTALPLICISLSQELPSNEYALNVNCMCHYWDCVCSSILSAVHLFKLLWVGSFSIAPSNDAPSTLIFAFLPKTVIANLRVMLLFVNFSLNGFCYLLNLSSLISMLLSIMGFISFSKFLPPLILLPIFSGHCFAYYQVLYSKFIYWPYFVLLK